MARFFIFIAATLTLAAAFSPSASTPLASSRRSTDATMKEAAAKAKWLASVEEARAASFRKHAPAPPDDKTPTTATATTEEKENAAKIAWLSKLEQPKLGVVSEAAAKAAWLNKLEDRKWGAGKVVPTAEETKEEEPVFESAEDAAKAAWLAKIERK